MKAVSAAHTVNQAADGKLGFHVLASESPHRPAANVWRCSVHGRGLPGGLANEDYQERSSERLICWQKASRDGASLYRTAC